MKEGKREQMPVTAWLIDELRRQWGVAATDALLRRSMKGDTSMQGGAFYVAELDAQGALQEFGATVGGRHCVCKDGLLQWVDAAGRALPPVSWYMPTARQAFHRAASINLLDDVKAAGMVRLSDARRRSKQC